MQNYWVKCCEMTEVDGKGQRERELSEEELFTVSCKVGHEEFGCTVQE